MRYSPWTLAGGARAHLMRDIAILAAALCFVFGTIAGMSITLRVRPIYEGQHTYITLSPTCDVMPREQPVWLEARR